jgi:hypothetical protein
MTDTIPAVRADYGPRLARIEAALGLTAPIPPVTGKDTLAKVRADFGPRITAVEEAMARWCCQHAGQRTTTPATPPPVAVVPAPPPPPPPPPSTGGYPASIVAAGLQSTYDLRLITGPGSALLTKSLPADAGLLPAGAALGTNDGPCLFINHAGVVDLTGWRLSGYQDPGHRQR